MVGEKVFELDTEYQFKFCHFNKYVSSIDSTDEDLLTATHTRHNFIINPVNGNGIEIIYYGGIS